MIEESTALAEFRQKIGEGDFLRTVAEAMLQLLMEADAQGPGVPSIALVRSRDRIPALPEGLRPLMRSGQSVVGRHAAGLGKRLGRARSWKPATRTLPTWRQLQRRGTRAASDQRRALADGRP
jgi:hypothetical protein